MQPEIIKLLQVQERDQKIRHIQKDLKEVPNLEARAKTQLAGDLAAVEKAHHAVQVIEVAIKAIELDINTRRTSIKRLQDQQFETRKNDEFRALGHEVERYQKDISDLEDKELDQMEKLETAKAAYAAAQGKLAATQGRVDEELVQLAERSAGLQRRLAELKAERGGLVGEVPEEWLSLYDRIFKKKGDSAVVPLTGEMCGGCHMKVVIGTIQKVKQAEGITQCESCGRILFLEG
jgi:predicted  nucleic acid-binding Zn-ribbon protein